MAAFEGGPEMGANPAHLPEFSSMNNHQLDYTDDDAGGTMSRLGQVSPFRTRTMKEYDQQISELKKDNFSLKLRIYFLEEKMQQKFATYGKEEDIGKANIELKVELESLKHDLADKQDLLCKASQALETLESEHQIELTDIKDRMKKDKELFEQRIDELERNLEKIEGPRAGLSKRKSEEWYRQAFSIADLTVENNERSDPLISSLQQNIADMETSIAEMNGKIQTYETTIQEMKSTVLFKDERITKLEEDKLKRDNVIRGLMEVVLEKKKECEDLNKRLEPHSKETRSVRSGTSVPTRSGATLLTDDQFLGDQREARTSDAGFQHDTLLFEMQLKDNKIRDLSEQLNQLQAQLESRADDFICKDELIAKLQDSLLSAERNFEELSARANKVSECELIIEELKLDLINKESQVKDAKATYSGELSDRNEKLANAEKESEKLNSVFRELENDMRHKADENKSLYNLLLESKNSLAELQDKLQSQDEYFEKIRCCLDKMLFEEIDLSNENVLLENDKVFHVLDDFSKLGKILRKVTALCGRSSDFQKLDSQTSSPPPDSALKSGFSSPVELHHFDLIRDSHAQESAASLLATNLRLKKEVARLEMKVTEASLSSKLLEEQLDGSRNQMELLLKQAEDSGRHDVSKINRLQFMLQSTEGTVRMLGRKVKYYRSLLAESGLTSLLSQRKLSHHSDTNLALAMPSHHRLSGGVVGSPIMEAQFATQFAPLGKSASFSAPVTPIKDIPSGLFMDLNRVTCSASHFEELNSLRRALTEKDDMLDKLKSEIETLRIPPPDVVDAYCQSDLVEIPHGIEPSLVKDADACRRIAESHHTSELLRRRLEELADFLESLLNFDENGTLDLSSLTPRKLATIRNQLEETRELSSTLSQSLMALDNTFALSEMSDAGQRLVSNEPGSDSGSSITGHERDGYATLVNSPADGAVKLQQTSKSCSRSLALGGGASGNRESMLDNYLLVLQPNSNALNGTLSVDVDDELPTCSLSNFGLQHSFLSSTNVFESARKKREEMSESDSWSEPDRHVSQQRIGLESSQVTPSAGKINGSSTTESEMASEFSTFPINRCRSVKGLTSPGKGNPQLGSSVLRMLAQADELEELSTSFKARPALTHSTFSGSIGAAKQNSGSPPLKPHRRLRSRSGDFSSSGKSPLKIDIYLREISELKKRLEESIHAYDLLREQFEKLLAASPTGKADLKDEYASVVQKLYEQLENSKAQLDYKNLQIQDAKKENALLLADIQDLTEKFESYKETIESLQSMLGEQQKTSKESSRKVERLEAAVAERERELTEVKAAREQSQQSLTRAKQLMLDNESALKHLRDLSTELEKECDRLRHECERMEQDERCHEETVRILNKQAEELRRSVESSQKLSVEQEKEKTSLLCRINELQHSIATKDEEAERACREMQILLASKQQELEEIERVKSDVEFHMTELQAQVETLSSLNQALKIELQMYEKMSRLEHDSGSPGKVDDSESGVDLLMTEVRSLHMQLERSVETNQALKAQLEKKASPSGEGGRLHLDFSERSEENCRNVHWPCPVSSPDTASSFSYVSGMCQSHVSEQADVYSSPDLGIESDRSRLSSLDRKNSSQKSHYLQPGFPGSGEWTVTNSAPPRTNASKEVSYKTADTRCLNLTFPACGKAVSAETTIAEFEDEGRKPHLISYPADYNALKKAICDGLNVLRTMRRKAKERLLALKSDVEKKVRDEEYVAWKEAYLGCDALKACLQESCHLVGKFWSVPLPLVPLNATSQGSMASGKEDNQLSLEEDLMRLYHELAKEKLRAEHALEKLEIAKRREAKMEKFIVKELKKTHSVLKLTGGKMEQQAKASSPQK